MEQNTIKSSAKEIFLHLLMLCALYASVASFITVWFQYANFLFPDKLESLGYGTYVYDVMRMAMSILVVAFPIYVFVGWLLGREFKISPEKREGRGRRWLIYFTLFASAITIAIDLITLIYRFFAGDLATRFVLKIVIVMIVAVAVLWYFIWDLKNKGAIGRKTKYFASIAGIIILASIIYGFTIMGTPAHQRDIRTDMKKIQDLQNMQSFISNYYVTKLILPANLSDIEAQSGAIPKDPQTGLDYEYKVTDKNNFELCSSFKTSSTGAGYISTPYYYNSNWDYKAGNVCFKRNIQELTKGMMPQGGIIKPIVQ